MDFFNYEWNAPFRATQPARRPAPAQRLSYDELLAALQDQFQPPPRPEPARSLQDLDPEGRRDVRQQSVISALASLGASMQTGDFRYAGAGAGQVADIERAGIADANAVAEAAWQRQHEEAAQAYQQQEKQREAAALHGMYERAVEGEDPEGAFAARAEAAARAGSMSELAQLATPEVKQKRAYIRSKGLDPDAWDANQRAEAELKAEIERANAAAAEAQELERKRKEEEIETAARVAEEKALREQGLDRYAPPQLPPLSRIEAEEAIRAKFRARGAGSGAATRRIVEAPDGTWGVAEIDAAGELVFKPGKGQAPKVDKQEMRVFTDEDGVTRPYVLDKTDGSWYPMKVSQRPRPESAQAPTPAGPPPAANAAPQANHWRNLAADALAKGGTEEEALRRLRAIGPQNGFTPEQILENAKAMARKRGWKG